MTKQSRNPASSGNPWLGWVYLVLDMVVTNVGTILAQGLTKRLPLLIVVGLETASGAVLVLAAYTAIKRRRPAWNRDWLKSRQARVFGGLVLVSMAMNVSFIVSIDRISVTKFAALQLLGMLVTLVVAELSTNLKNVRLLISAATVGVCVWLYSGLSVSFHDAFPALLGFLVGVGMAARVLLTRGMEARVAISYKQTASLVSAMSILAFHHTQGGLNVADVSWADLALLAVVGLFTTGLPQALEVLAGVPRTPQHKWGGNLTPGAIGMVLCSAPAVALPLVLFIQGGQLKMHDLLLLPIVAAGMFATYSRQRMK